jgi:hypothetical protein
MLKFQRNTHNPDGSARWDGTTNPHEFRGDKKSNIEYDHAGLIVHMLHSDKPMSFMEVVQETQRYCIQFTEDWHGEVMTKGEVALGLIGCLEQGWAKVVEAPDKGFDDEGV